ncbi:potassium channel family protein [Fulvivirga lutimaris]|uniref:potassium channel family protein n=1 Tax=Fulvivirga lutimaris TaxID=1819566 RepID=UPI001FEB2D71|nr:potassium channel protein [Fulvivirga lutimaris]
MSLGAVGYIIIEGFAPLDAIYMAVITFATVGYNEVNTLSSDGKIFTIIFIMVNLGIFAYTVSVLSSFFFEGELRRVFKNIITSRDVKKLKNHVIVCGFGRNGIKVCEELRNDNIEFIVIESNTEIINAFPEEKNYFFINGNATLDEVLLEAGIKEASTIICSLPLDADNVFITLTARELNRKIKIISKANEPTSEKKLYRAGATYVVMPDRLGGIHMANLITKPYVIEFLELLNGVGDSKLVLEEVSHDKLKAEYQNKSLRELDVRNKTGATIIAFKDEVEGFIFNPHSEKAVQEGDVLIVLGNTKNIAQFKQVFVV